MPAMGWDFMGAFHLAVGSSRLAWPGTFGFRGTKQPKPAAAETQNQRGAKGKACAGWTSQQRPLLLVLLVGRQLNPVIFAPLYFVKNLLFFRKNHLCQKKTRPACILLMFIMR